MPKPYFAKIDTMETKDNLSLNAVPSIDKGGAEDVDFETLARGPVTKEAGAETWQRLLPSDEAMTILHARESTELKGPGFGYWLVGRVGCRLGLLDNRRPYINVRSVTR